MDGFTGEDDRVQAGGLAVTPQVDRNESWNQHMKEQNEKFRPFLSGNGKINDFKSRQCHKQTFTSKKSKIILKFLAQATGWKMLIVKEHKSGEPKEENEFSF